MHKNFVGHFSGADKARTETRAQARQLCSGSGGQTIVMLTSASIDFSQLDRPRI